MPKGGEEVVIQRYIHGSVPRWESDGVAYRVGGLTPDKARVLAESMA